MVTHHTITAISSLLSLFQPGYRERSGEEEARLTESIIGAAQVCQAGLLELWGSLFTPPGSHRGIRLRLHQLFLKFEIKNTERSRSCSSPGSILFPPIRIKRQHFSLSLLTARKVFQNLSLKKQHLS